jgi:hypothetical protein
MNRTGKTPMLDSAIAKESLRVLNWLSFEGIMEYALPPQGLTMESMHPGQSKL